MGRWPGVAVKLVILASFQSACSKPAALPPRPELVDVLHDLADRACGCDNDKACVREIRDEEWEPTKRDLMRHGLTGTDKSRFDAELARLRACGDAAGLTIWL